MARIYVIGCGRVGNAMGSRTGYTGTAAVNLLLEGFFTDTKVFPPEQVGKDKKCLDFILNYLAQRNIKLEKFDPMNYKK
ncbi:MAG: hypothetical protein V3S48_07110 [Candidatus Neomarinimicrobiota bacterium]